MLLDCCTTFEANSIFFGNVISNLSESLSFKRNVVALIYYFDIRQAFNEAERGWEETANQLALTEQKLDRVSYERDELSEIYSPVALKRNLGCSRGRSTPYTLGLRKKSKKFGSEF